MEVLMKICWYLIGLSALPALLASCAPLPELIEPFAGDVHPPVLLGVQAAASREVRIQFDETARVRDGEITVDPPRALVSGTTEETTVVLTFNEDLEPGTLFWIDGAVADQQGNITSFLVNVYGRNERPPSLVVNEFVCEGSTTHPDVVELRVLSAGNLAGLSLLDGSPGTYDDAIVLPALEVAVDDYILVHFKPQNIVTEVNETVSKTQSGGLDSSESAWDFWVEGGDGIPNTTGAITISEFPGGPILDAVLYSTKTYDPESENRGYGLASQLAQAEELVTLGAWVVEGGFVVPSDGVNPTDSTATRSICRSSDSVDTNHRDDWHIVPTGTSTLGEPNSDLRY